MKRTVNSARNPQWANTAQTAINLEVDFDELDEQYVPFTATSYDSMDYGVDIYNRAVAGEFGEIADFVAPANYTGEKALAVLRATRQKLLDDTDYIEMPTKWATLTADEQTAWSTYRNALRDLPATYPNAELHWNDNYTKLTTWVNVVWPTKPEQ